MKYKSRINDDQMTQFAETKTRMKLKCISFNGTEQELIEWMNVCFGLIWYGMRLITGCLWVSSLLVKKDMSTKSNVNATVTSAILERERKKKKFWQSECNQKDHSMRNIDEISPFFRAISKRIKNKVKKVIKKIDSANSVDFRPSSLGIYLSIHTLAHSFSSFHLNIHFVCLNNCKLPIDHPDLS